jgi:hypothetical protein
LKEATLHVSAGKQRFCAVPSCKHIPRKVLVLKKVKSFEVGWFEKGAKEKKLRNYCIWPEFCYLNWKQCVTAVYS